MIAPVNMNPLSHSPTFSVHGTAKQMQASVRLPGVRSGKRKDGTKWEKPKPSCTPEQGLSFATVGRTLRRDREFGVALEYVNSVAGGEPRKNRRAMARARAKRSRQQ